MVSRDSPVTGRGAVREMDQVAEDPLADFGQVVRKAAELVLRVRGSPDSGTAGGQGRQLRSEPWRAGDPGELDLAATVANVAGVRRPRPGSRRARAPAGTRASRLLIAHRSFRLDGGRKLSLAAVLAAVVAQLRAAPAGPGTGCWPSMSRCCR